MPSAPRAMLLVLAAAVVLANIHQPYPEIAPLQHVPTVLLILAAPLLLARWPLSGGACGCVLAFLLLHTLAGRYIYSYVPYAQWLAALSGKEIATTTGRNGFDRLVHLGFGLLGAPVLIEIARHHGGQSLRLACWHALLFVGAASALYEIFEWLLTMLVAPDMADAYNGQQGDLWDAQKDMALAMAGAALACAGIVIRSRVARR